MAIQSVCKLGERIILVRNDETVRHRTPASDNLLNAYHALLYTLSKLEGPIEILIKANLMEQ